MFEPQDEAGYGLEVDFYEKEIFIHTAGIDTTGLLFFNYFGRRSEQVYVNHHLPGRMAPNDPP